MISFRDMTFCRHYETCRHAEECHRPLTPEIVKAAGDMLISVFADKPECHSDNEEGDTHEH